ncbi:MAG: SRPBCC domain-containing protein [Aquaticitalea sp.]
MKTNLIFEFIVDRAKATVNVKKEFAADRCLVWDAFTKSEILDQWWAPKPWTAKTKSMDFKVGGQRLYAMCGPESEEHWALMSFTSISPKTNLKYSDSFCDKEGVIIEEMPDSYWNLDFIEQAETTLVDIHIKMETLEDLEKHIEMGFKEGFTRTLHGLDDLFLKLNTKNS